ncbi:riboflavin kinase/FAD synthetase [Entomoplasma ellychniae]|uniref:riboflavin kinase n=1 Tax=Entomoplasma ellychniae TaxID=2114 RepID=A0A8E2UAM8_9MOLU|nr:riboflavin kinase [Entomoplasma ellychniae]PPE04560.1 riboflavin kinase/FAD synthetase [Entomoplasma ellychniae]
MKINYNDMLMMLWNLDENVAVFSDFSKWDLNEDNLIIEAKKEGKKVILINKENNNLLYTIPTKGMEIKASKANVDLVVWYGFNEQFDYELIKNNLNIKKAFVFDNNIDLEHIKKAFSFEIFIMKYNNSLNELTKKSKIALREGKFKDYQKINNFNYSFSGFVSQGNQLGRTIGYPTANIIVDNHLILKPGVYVTIVKLPSFDEQLQGISVYWTNKQGVSVFETHILNFEQDIYGWGIEIEMLYYIRESIEVKDFNHLKKLLNEDKKIAINYFKGE